MPKLRSSQKSKVPLPGTPQRVQTDTTDSQPPTPMEDQRPTGNLVGVECPTCSKPIKDATGGCEGEEALFCEGTCQCWYHHWYHCWCVGVTGVRFQVLSESNEPFLCQACISHQQHIIIRELQSCVQVLTGEIWELKAAVCELQITVQAGTPPTREAPGENSVGEGKLPWNVVARKRHVRSKGKGKGRKQGPGNEAAIQNTHKPITPLPQSEHTSQSLSSHEREVLPGFRRVWGTMRSCSVTSVAKAIRQLTNISGEMQVKRKYKTTDTGKLLNGGYIVRAEESLLKQLDGKSQAADIMET